MDNHTPPFCSKTQGFHLTLLSFYFYFGNKMFYLICSLLRDSRGATLRKRENENKTRGDWGEEGGLPFSPTATFSQIMRACFSVHFTYASSHYVRGWNRLPHLRPWRRAASFPVVLGDLGCDVTFPACRENISLSSKPPLVTRIARTGQGEAGRRPFFARMNFKGPLSQNLSKCKQARAQGP